MANAVRWLVAGGRHKVEPLRAWALLRAKSLGRGHKGITVPRRANQAAGAHQHGRGGRRERHEWGRSLRRRHLPRFVAACLAEQEGLRLLDFIELRGRRATGPLRLGSRAQRDVMSRAPDAAFQAPAAAGGGSP